MYTKKLVLIMQLIIQEDGEIVVQERANIDTSQITAADLTIFDHTGTTLHTTITLKTGSVDVYAGVIGAPAPGRFSSGICCSFYTRRR
jgi:hypothetical protein